MFKAVDPKPDFPKLEEEILGFWEREKIFEKSLEQTKKGEPFTFYDGPPFATGLPHYGHILASTIKDLIPRYQTMNGKYVRRRWGWDCHGLPIEEIVERKLGISGKADIEKLGTGLSILEIRPVGLENLRIILKEAIERKKQKPEKTR